MRFRFALVVPVVLLAGCTFEHRIDGGYPLHTDDGPDPMQRRYDVLDESTPLDAAVVEPLGASGTATTGAAAPDAMTVAPTAPSPTGSTAIGVGSASGDGAATGRGPAALGTTGNPTAP